MYLSSFHFPSEHQENRFFVGQQRTCYNSYYPFGIMPSMQCKQLDFAPITILYGNNGSGKTTMLNLIANKISAKRSTNYNKSPFYGDYLNMCHATPSYQIASEIAVITSDDVFDFLLDMRALNDGIDNRRDLLFDEYIAKKKTKFKMQSLDDYEALKQINEAKSITQSKYVDTHLGKNIIGKSNGESALLYFKERIKENGLYLLDEPENSLSAKNQKLLVEYIQESVRFYDCQFIIASHSPFILALKDARIYDLDESPVTTKDWRELESIKLYQSLFQL